MGDTFRLKALGDKYTLDYSFIVGFHDNPREKILADNREAPNDTYAASFTHDPGEDPDDGTVYLPRDLNLKVIVHEAAHAIIGAFTRRGLALPDGGDDDAEAEEVFVHTLGVFVEQIVETYNDEVGESV